jgi:GABA(A) receptor-associated protein
MSSKASLPIVSFKQANSLQDRLDQFSKVNSAHPNKIPVIVERAPQSSSSRRTPATMLPDIDKNKYLVPGDLTVLQFMSLIRKRIKLANDQALFIYVNGTLPASSTMFSGLYAEHRDEDGFLYVVYTGESSFGQ